MLNDFFKATGNSETLEKKKKRLINKKVMFNWSWLGFANPVTLEPEVTGGWYSGLWSLIGLCTKYENNRKWFIYWVCDFTWNDPVLKGKFNFHFKSYVDNVLNSIGCLAKNCSLHFWYTIRYLLNGIWKYFWRTSFTINKQNSFQFQLIFWEQKIQSFLKAI